MSTKNNEKPDDDCGVLSHSLEVVSVVPANICRLVRNLSHPVILSSLAWLFQPLKRTRQMEPRK